MSEKAVGVKIPDDQRLTYRITPSSGGWMTAQAVGGQIVALGDLLRSVAEEESDVKWRIVITKIQTNDDGSMEFELAILPEIPAVRAKS